MTPVEIIAVVFSIVVLARLIAILVLKPKSIIKFVGKMFPMRGFLTILFVAVGFLVGYYLLQELTISQIAAGILLGVIFVGLAVIQYPKEFTSIAVAVLKHKGRMWMAWVLFVILSVWVLVNVFW